MMKAIVLPDYNSNVIRAMKSLAVQKIKIPRPGEMQVLIKVAAAPCNPSDIAFMRGVYIIRKRVPVIMGFECSGTVLETGISTEAMKLLGKRVSCFSQPTDIGTWGEYMVTDWTNCIILKDGVDFEQAGTLCINPFTAYALFKMFRETGSKAIIQNASSGQIGIFIRSLAIKAGVPVINIVRKDEHVLMLQDSGEHYVLNLTAPDFAAQLKDLAYSHKATIAFDAVGGDLTGIILNAMPRKSVLVLYGGLSGKPIGLINALDVIFDGKSVRGFNLGDWKEAIGHEKFLTISEELQDLIISGVISTQIQGTFRLEQVQEALEKYIRNMSAGKILFTP
jgi:NADPH2:quinone reductase